jgi:ABC-type nickel/cobalt efflux system permease component RcnA
MRRLLGWLLLAITTAMPAAGRADTVASLLGNFTINQFCGLQMAAGGFTVHYVVVFGQLPALRELHLADADGNGVTTQAERDAHVAALAQQFAEALSVRVDGIAVPLRAAHWTSDLPTEQGGFSLRVAADFAGAWPAAIGHAEHRLEFGNENYAGRMGWHEIVVGAAPGVTVYDTNGYGTSLTGALSEALRALPATGPLDERTVHLRFTAGTAPTTAVLLAPRPGAPPRSDAARRDTAAPGNVAGDAAWLGDAAWIARKTRVLVDSIAAPRLAPRIAVLALLGALLLGAVHALSPGHGKAIVGTYLIGSRGTPRHAAFLGLTVTITHTIGVFILGFATLYASRFIVPERLFPILSLVSALLVLGMGLVLLAQRTRAARRALAGSPKFHAVPATARPGAEARPGPGSAVLPHGLMLAHGHGHAAGHGHDHAHAHAHAHAHGALHSHGGALHSHLPPGAAGEAVTWRSLLALGISGGLVPCPAAMVLLLAAVALDKTAFGMLLVVAFSLGLALTLTAVGLAFLYARNRFRRPDESARWPHLLPVLSAITITLLGAFLCIGALRSFGV